MGESTVSKVSSNQRRTSWRVRCRNCLSAHIGEPLVAESRKRLTQTKKAGTLGLQVDPDEVRLQPDDETLYAWQVDDPQLELIFKRSLSKHSVGAYVKLCSEVGKGFRAVHRNEVDNAVRSNREQLQRMEEETIRLERAMNAATVQSQTLSSEKIALETRLQDAAKQITEMEQRIMALESRVSEHQKEAKEWMSLAECYERTYTQCSVGISQAILFLQSISAGSPLPDIGVKPAV